MARLPQPGGDAGNWGDILNDYLAQSLKSDGTIKDNSIGSAQLQDNSVTGTALAPNSITGVKLADDSIAKAQLNLSLRTELDEKITETAANAAYVRYESQAAAGEKLSVPVRTELGNVHLAGTPVGGQVQVAKPSGDTRPGVWEYVHNSATGYMFHLLAGSSMAAPAAVMAFGLDTNNSGAGILVAHKKGGQGIVVRQQSTIDASDAYGIKIEGLSTLAPSVRIEQNVAGAGTGLQLLAFKEGSTPPTATQLLFEVGDHVGNAGGIFASDGRIQWKRAIRVLDDSGSSRRYFEAGENTAYTWTDPNAYATRLGKKELEFFSPSGGGSLWSFGWVSQGSHLLLKTGAAGVYGAAPTTNIIDIQHNKLGFFTASPVAQKARIGQLIDSSSGTVSNTVTAAGVSYDGTAENAFRASVVAKINALEATLSATGGGFGLTS